MQTQAELELETYQFGRSRAISMMRGNEDKGRANNNPYAQAVFRRFVLPLAEIIREDLNHRRVGRRQAHVKLLRPIDCEAAAYIAVRATLIALLAGKGDNLKEGAGRNVVSEVGRGVYHEYVLEHFAEIEPDLFYHLVNDFERRMSRNERHRMTVFKMQAKKAGVHFTEWGSGDCDQVGAYLVEQLERLGMVETKQVTIQHRHKNNIRTKIVVTMSDECSDLISQIKNFVVESTPYFLPCVEPPKPWTSVTEGGFHTKEMRRMMPWVVKCHPSQRDNFREADMSQELRAINTLQEVEWRINKPLLNAVRQIAKHFDMEEIISQAEEPKPHKPDWLTDNMTKDEMDETQLEQFVRWKRAMADWHTQRKVRGTRWGRFQNAMKVATKFEDYAKLWFVYFEDFRARKYVQTTGVNPQGSDLQKALLEFANGKELATPEAVSWFKIAGANRWGYDKVSLDDRVKWVDEHADLLRSFAADPISNSQWQEADSPLMFLAWCFEYAEWCTNPEFVSRIAVGMDGSCNGLQNFSAMLLDEVGGKATNLVPADLPNDIYQMVSDVAEAALEAAPPDEHGLRERWLKHGLNRTLVKRSVMTLPYGSTRYSCAEFIVQDYLKAGKVPEFAKTEYAKAANYLSHFVWAAIGEVVVKAREAMQWLQDAARQLVREGAQEIQWVTPSGFPAIQAYWEQDVKQIRTQLCGGAVLKMHRDIDVADSNRHKNGIAPNFVHSLDASHLTLTVNAAREDAGITSFAMIHDDYGTHAADAQTLYHIIREQFVWMYTTFDMLAEFKAKYPQLPPPPERGNLDVRQVLDSPYFFS